MALPPASAVWQMMQYARTVGTRNPIKQSTEKGTLTAFRPIERPISVLKYFRYVQMLERQHYQLIAGVHEMFKLGQLDSDWPNAMRALAHRNESKPLTHQILEALGVLQSSAQEEADQSDGEWQTFDCHPQDDGVINESGTPSPTLKTPILGALETTQKPTVSYRSTFLQPQHSKFERDHLADMEFNPELSPMNFSNTPLMPVPPFSANMAYFMQPPLADPFSEPQVYDETLGLGPIL